MKPFKSRELVTYRYKLTNASNFYKVRKDWEDRGVIGYPIAHCSDKNPSQFAYIGDSLTTFFLGSRPNLRKTRSNENFCISLAFLYEKLDH